MSAEIVSVHFSTNSYRSLCNLKIHSNDISFCAERRGDLFGQNYFSISHDCSVTWNSLVVVLWNLKVPTALQTYITNAEVINFSFVRWRGNTQVHRINHLPRCRYFCNRSGSCGLQWRHNERNGVSNHRRLDCLRKRLDQRKHQHSASLACVGGIHRWPVDSSPKGLVTRKMFPFDDVVCEKPTRYIFSHWDQGRSYSVCERKHICGHIGSQKL